ncbi:ribonucleotide reductase subunit alpha [Aquabacterium sp.]|uniref:ribonucleotide reductase subunit alpha n=1 Tax=Aquabacterium sp. TaxID=1872578 RepID=UPI003782F6D1
MPATAFEQLVAAAAAQPEPQALLFVFTGAELPADATPAQRARYEAGAGGALTPLMCCDKTVDELGSFDALVEESRRMGPPWSVVFVAGLSGSQGLAPSPQAVEAALQTMIERVKRGAVEGLLAFSQDARLLSFS